MLDKLKGLSLRLRIVITAVLSFLLIAAYWNLMPLAGYSPFLNFEVVEPGKLLRSAQPWTGDLARIESEYGLGTIINLDGGEDRSNVNWARANGVRVLSMNMKADIPPTDEQVELFFRIMEGDTIDPGKYRDVITQHYLFNFRSGPIKFDFPVLIHCQGGADRTGVMVALYHMAFQGWDLGRAKRDMRSHFHIPSQHPAQFEYLDKATPTVEHYLGVARPHKGVN